MIVITDRHTDNTMSGAPPPTQPKLSLVSLSGLHETLKFPAGFQVDWWPADNRCPQCDAVGRERAGADFQHMMRCVKCGICWTPGTFYLRTMKVTQ